MKSQNIILAAFAAVLVIGGGVALTTLGRGKGGAVGPGGGGGGGGGGSLPADDLTENWGTTPANLRPLFMAAEKAAAVPGTARMLAVLAQLRSRFSVATQNKSQPAIQASQGQYLELKGKRPALSSGSATLAANFGQGGLLGFLGPEFLWSGYKELGAQTPLLGSDPALMLDPRYALYAAVTRLQEEVLPRLLPTDGALEAAIGIHNPDLLGRREEPLFKALRTAYVDASRELGINLTKIPKPKSNTYPGAKAALTSLVGSAPVGDISL